jgi:hypothetical protein
MILEPKHKNFKDQYKIKEREKDFFKYQAPHVYAIGFYITLLSGNYKLGTQCLLSGIEFYVIVSGGRFCVTTHAHHEPKYFSKQGK